MGAAVDPAHDDALAIAGANGASMTDENAHHSWRLRARKFITSQPPGRVSNLSSVLGNLSQILEHRPETELEDNPEPRLIKSGGLGLGRSRI